MDVALPFRSILITGADGFVGRFLLPALLPRLAGDARVTLVGRGEMGPAGIHRISLDLLDQGKVDMAVHDTAPDLVIHLAAQASVASSASDGAQTTWAVNLGGTMNLARSCVDHGFAGSFFFVSSAEVYGRAFSSGAVTEQTVPLPHSPYGRSKAAAEMMLADVLPPTVQLIVVRPANHSGPGQDARFVLPSIAAQVAAVETGRATAVMIGNTDAERDFLDVRDVVNAYMAILARAGTLDKRMLFNIASGRTVSIADMLSRLRKMSLADLPVVADPTRQRASDLRRAEVDSHLVRELTEWSPTYALDEMLHDLLAYERDRVSGKITMVVDRTSDQIIG